MPTVKKPWYKSKTIIINALVGVGMFLADNSGTIPIAPEKQVLILSGINVVLRIVSKGKITL